MTLKGHIVYVLFVLVVVSACKSTQPMLGTSTDISGISQKDLLRAMANQKTDYTSVEIKKYDAEFNNGTEQKGFKGYLRYVPNGTVMASISPAMGIEMFRLLATEDTLGFIDRYNKQFYKGNYRFLESKLGVDLDFDLLQFIISSNVNMLPERFRFDKSFTFSKEGRFLSLSKTYKDDVFVEFSYNSSYQLKRVYLKSFTDAYSVEIFYKSYFDVEDYAFPEVIAVKVINGRKLFTFDIEYKSIEYNKTLNFPFSVSSKYNEISL